MPMPVEAAVTDVLLIGAEELENLGTRYLAAVLRESGYTVELVPFSRQQDADAAVLWAELTRPRLIGLSIIFQYRAPEFMALAAELKQRFPSTHITCGGHFATFAAPELLRDFPALDSVVRGEGENTLVQLMDRLDEPETWEDIPGLSFRRHGRSVANPSRPPIADLDSLPFPARDTPPQRHFGIGFSPILGSRGCYRDCAFCSIRSFYGASLGKPQRFRSAPNLAAEMEMLYHDHGVRFFVFNDDEWFPPGLARIARVEALERELRRRQLDVIMSIKCRADDVEENLFRRLRDMGVIRAYVGVESGSDHSLRTLNKRTTVAQNRQALEILNKVGMLGEFGLIFFDPESSVEDIRANLDFFHSMAGEGQAPLSFGRMEVYAGTPIQERLMREGRLTGSYLAWSYTIADPRVELLLRLMYATMRHRQFDSDGLGKQCAISCYEWTIYRYLCREQVDPDLAAGLRSILSEVNRNSLATLEEMFDFVTHKDIHSVALVNDRAAGWATRINLFDLEYQARLSQWRALLAEQAERLHAAGGAYG